MKNRGRSYGVLFVICLLFSLTFVLAAPGDSPISDLGSMINAAFNYIKPLLNIVLGGSVDNVTNQNSNISSIALSRIMFFVIIFALLFMTLKQMPMIADNDFVLWAVTIATSVLATRWLSSGKLVDTFLLPYDTMGIAIAGLLPLGILFFFIEFTLGGRQYKFIRKFSWIFVGILFLFLWFTRYDALVASAKSFGGYVYVISALLCFAFSFLDHSIQTWWNKAKMQKSIAMGSAGVANEYNMKIQNIHKLDASGRAGYTSEFSPGLTGERAINHDLKEFQKRIADLKS